MVNGIFIYKKIRANFDSKNKIKPKLKSNSCQPWNFD